MASKEHLGLFWADNAFHFVETSNDVPTKAFSAPFDLTHDISSSQLLETTEGIKLTAIIQKALRDEKITRNNLNLSLPTKDIIFRSFVIPWMQASEVKGVVEFEANKYIPFSLDELSFSYQAITFTENRKKQILILFAAIRRDILEKYCSILEHSGLKIDLIEPAPMSVVRALTAKKLFPKNQTVAVIETDNLAGRIIIVNKNAPHFVREFQLALPTDQSPDNTDALQARLFNEIRISLDYYGRQHSNSKVDKILLIAPPDAENVEESLSDYLSLPISRLKMHQIFELKSEVENGALTAFGNCLRESVTPDINFDLTWKTTESEEAEDLEGEVRPNYVQIGVAAAVCLVFVLSFFKFSNDRITNFQTKIESLSHKLGPFKSLETDAIRQQVQDSTNKLNSYNRIRPKSKVSLFLTLTTRLLPKGVWLNHLSIEYSSDDSMIIQMGGFAYFDKVDQQVRLINKLIFNLKSNPEFAETFKDVKRASVNRQDMGGYTVTSFSITCQ